MQKKQIVIFGGCFNPPLYSHLSLAEQLTTQYNQIKKVIFMPVNSKYKKVDLISNEHRYNMLKLACKQNEKFEVSRLEMDATRTLYTIESLRKMQEIYEEEIAFMMGSDNLKELSTWKQADELTKNFKIYVLKRANDEIEKIIAENEWLKKNQKAFILVEKSVVSNLSSTLVRQKIKEGTSIRYLTAQEVIEYIKKNKLYQS